MQKVGGFYTFSRIFTHSCIIHLAYFDHHARFGNEISLGGEGIVSCLNQAAKLLRIVSLIILQTNPG